MKLWKHFQFQVQEKVQTDICSVKKSKSISL